MISLSAAYKLQCMNTQETSQSLSIFCYNFLLFSSLAHHVQMLTSPLYEYPGFFRQGCRSTTNSHFALLALYPMGRTPDGQNLLLVFSSAASVICNGVSHSTFCWHADLWVNQTLHCDHCRPTRKIRLSKSSICSALTVLCLTVSSSSCRQLITMGYNCVWKEHSYLWSAGTVQRFKFKFIPMHICENVRQLMCVQDTQS